MLTIFVVIVVVLVWVVFRYRVAPFGQREHWKCLGIANKLPVDDRQVVAHILADAISFAKARKSQPYADMAAAYKAMVMYHKEMRHGAIKLGAHNRQSPLWLGAAMCENWAMVALSAPPTDPFRGDKIRDDLEGFARANLSITHFNNAMRKKWD
ncbi:hypothetical protein [Mesorhizobium sp. M0586]